MPIDAKPIVRQPIKQFHVLNAKNNMNSVTIDANDIQQNLQLSCQSNQYNYSNSSIYRELNVSSGQPVPHEIHNNNNVNDQQYCWLNETKPISNISEGVQVGLVKEINNGDIVNDLIKSFNTSLDVTDAHQIQLPQIILSDFSNDQQIPPITPLFLTVQTQCQTFSEHPAQLTAFSLTSKPTTASSSPQQQHSINNNLSYDTNF